MLNNSQDDSTRPDLPSAPESIVLKGCSYENMQLMRFSCLNRSDLSLQKSASRTGSVVTLENLEEEVERKSRRDSHASSAYIQMPLVIQLTPAFDLVWAPSLKKCSGGASSLLNEKLDKLDRYEYSNYGVIDRDEQNSDVGTESYQEPILDQASLIIDLQSEIQCESIIEDRREYRIDLDLKESAVVVAIDFGTINCSYGYAFSSEPNQVVMMRNFSENSFKIPTVVLLSPDREFHSFGYEARDYYNNMDPRESKNWLLFEQFKMSLYQTQNLSDFQVTSVNGLSYSALDVFSVSLGWLKTQILLELNDQCYLENEDIKWVLTVPAIWSQQAKSLMREAAYRIGLTSRQTPEKLLIALEPEAASIYIQSLKINRLNTNSNLEDVETNLTRTVGGLMQSGMRYVVVDCGGGTIDITVHEIIEINARSYLKEIYKASGGPFGSTGVNREFEELLERIFGCEFIRAFKTKHPSGYSALMGSFERKKISFDESSSLSVNIELPYSFISAFKKPKSETIEKRVKSFNKLVKDQSQHIEWSDQGILRLPKEVMKKLFKPVIESICETLHRILANPHVQDVEYLFLVGGFASSTVLQQEIKQKYAGKLQVIIPNEASLCVLKGAVMFGIDSSIVRVRRSRLTYGVGCLERFDSSKHCQNKKIVRNGIDWCRDVFDKFVVANQCISSDETVTRFYAPVNQKNDRREISINFFSSESPDPQYVTQSEVNKCGKLVLALVDGAEAEPERRIRVDMSFGDTEIKARAIDEKTGRFVNVVMRY